MADRSRLLQSRYGDQSSHTRVAGPETIAAAKKKRAEQRRAAVLALQHDEEEFIPLDATHASRSVAHTSSALDTYAGPHPESGLQREEDDLGSGEDEHAEFTGATERIPLGRDAERKRKQEQRRQMRSLIAEATGAPDEEEDIAIVVREPPRRAAPASAATTTIHDPVSFDTDTMLVRDEDPEEREEQEAWERAQLSRMDMPGVRQEQDPREPSPHRSAPVPLTSALPTPTSCLSRLEAQIVSLDERTKEEEQRRTDAEHALRSLDQEELKLKSAVEAAEAKSAWFADLDRFVETMAAFLDVKMPLLDTLEHNALGLMIDRKVSRQRARALALEDAVVLCYGSSNASLWLPSKDEPQRPMSQDGDGNAVARQARRPLMTPVPDLSAQRLTTDEVAHFHTGRDELARNVARLLQDTHAPEFRHPLAVDDSGAWHPRSLAARFHAWRTKFPAEYDLAWGGLALANAWEFFARYELVQWDPLWCTERAVQDGDVCLEGPISGLEGFAFEREISAYVDADPREQNKARGGDAEASATLISNVVVPRLIAVAEQAYDVWSASETDAALVLVEQVSYLLDVSGWRFQSLVRAFLTPFQAQIEMLSTALSAPKTTRGLVMHPDVPAARAFLAHEFGTLAQNLGRWSVYYHGAQAPDWSASERGVYEQLADRLLGEILWPLVVDAGALGGRTVAQQLLARFPMALLPSDVRGRYEALANNDTL
ncbi:hypothetical protein MOBT1_001329 [Malassezia obtusa]|uniref:GCF C-terminal domain-containing protein n=1 Tax=Malassezia obtusa TaxID=76774 RepID=A0AAF0DY25_9BASI|nr:hypothetical protein MOBT1_001329 [Malassezia obtusa]